MTEEQKAARRANLAKAREAQRAKKAAAETEEAPAPAMPPIAHETAEPWAIIEPAEPAPLEAGDDFERFLAAQSEATREVLTDLELRVIYESEVKRAGEERKEALKKDVRARAARHARLNAGLTTPEAAEAAALRDNNNRKVSWIVNLPEAGNSGRLIDEGIRIDGRLLYHGQEVHGTLAEYTSYREIEWRAHQGELDFQGKGRLSKLRQNALGNMAMVPV